MSKREWWCNICEKLMQRPNCKWDERASYVYCNKCNWGAEPAIVWAGAHVDCWATEQRKQGKKYKCHRCKAPWFSHERTPSVKLFGSAPRFPPPEESDETETESDESPPLKRKRASAGEALLQEFLGRLAKIEKK